MSSKKARIRIIAFLGFLIALILLILLIKNKWDFNLVVKDILAVFGR